MMPFKALDYYDVDSLLTEEERLIRDTIRSFVSDQVMPRIEKHHRDGTFPVELIPGLAELGTLGATLQGYECAGLGPVAYGLIMQELERGDSGLRSFVSVQGGLVMFPLHAFGSEAQKNRWLPALARGEKIGCFGLTEPDYGSNPAGMLTRAVQQNDRYVLNGTKAWITNGSLADLAVVWAKLDGEIGAFLVEKGTPGFTARNHEGKFSLRASVTSELALQDCAVPLENRLEGARGLKAALACLNQARYGIAWGVVGSAMAVIDEALGYAKTRIVFGKPVAGHQLQQRKLVWMATEITKAQLLCLRLGRLKESGRARPQQVSMAKMNNCWMARECARLGREILGASGITDEYQVGRHFCNLESVYTYEGTHDIHTLIVGEDLTDLGAYS